MPSSITRADWDYLLLDLEKLQTEWERDHINEHRRSLWAYGVFCGIEIGRRRLAEESAPSWAKLTALLARWGHIRNRKVARSAEESVKGLDFGIQLVIERISQCLQARPKPPRP